MHKTIKISSIIRSSNELPLDQITSFFSPFGINDQGAQPSAGGGGGGGGGGENGW